MKNLSKILLLTLILGLLLGAVFAISAFAEDEAPEVKYVVPDEAKNATFVLFEAETGKYVYHSNHFAADGAVLNDAGVNLNDNIFDGIPNTINVPSGSYYILMQKDYEVTNMWGVNPTTGAITQTAGFNNLFTRYPKYVIDLGGHTMTFSLTLNAQVKGTNGAVLNFTFKNGSIVNNGKTPFNFTVHNANRTANIAFEDITFSVAEGKKPTCLVSSNSAATKEQKLVVNMTFKGCTFDTTHFAQMTYVCAQGISSKNITNNLHFQDCTVTGDHPGYFAPVGKNVDDGGSVTFTAATNDTLTTPYGIIPSKYASEQNYPFVLFNQNTHALLWAGAHWGDETKTDNVPDGLLMAMTSNSKSKTVALLRCDYTIATSKKAQYYNQGNMYGTHIIDLGNHTVTGTFFFENVKGATSDMSLTVKNGAFNLQSSNLLYITGTSYCHKKTEEDSGYLYDPETTKFYKSGTTAPGTNEADDTPVYYYTSNCKKNASYLFEDVRFTNLSDSKYLIYDSASNIHDALKVDVQFKNCDIDYSVRRTAPLCNLGQVADGMQVGFFKSNGAYSANYNSGSGYTNPVAIKTSTKHVVNITLEGGSITNTYDTSFPALVTPKYHKETKSAVLTKGENGYLVMKTNPNDTFYPSSTEYFFADDNVNSIFALSEKAETHNIYAFAKKIEYGYLPAIYENDPDKYPILIFNLTDGLVEITKTQWGGVKGWDGSTDNADADPENALMYLASNGSKTKSYALYLQKDITTTNYHNTGSIEGSHIVDLNGHTLTLGANMYRMQAKDTGTCAFNTKNGTIKVGRRMLVEIGALSSGKSVGKIMDITFSNVTIENLITSGENVGRLVADTLGGSDTITANVNFVDCTVNAASSYTGELFALGMHANAPSYTVNVSFKGGSINYAGDTVATALLLNNSMTNANKVVKFLADEDGNYTTVTAKEGVDVSKAYYPVSRSIVRMLSRTSVADGIATYAMDTLYGFSSAYLNLANELNFIYRAKLPEGFENATVTFVIDGFERTVSAFGVDENENLLFKLPSINPAQMGKAISATLTATKDGVTHTLTYDTLSVKSYLNALTTENSPELATLVDALLTYGAAAQQFDGQSAEDFVTELGELEAIADSVYNVQKSGTGIAQFAMNLRGSFFLRVGIVLPEGTDMTNVKLVATKGENVKEYNLASYTADGTMIAIDYDAITALELGELITFTLMDGENVLSTITLNAYSYLYTANTNKYAEQYPTLAALARAIYYYGEAAKAYATNG